MSDIEIKASAETIIKNLVSYSYSQIFDITPAERDLVNLHVQAPSVAEPLIGLMFCSVMLGNKQQAKEYAGKIWNLNNTLSDSLEMLYADMLLNIGEFEKAESLISARMDDMEKNLDLFYSTVVKYALCTGELYILNNLADYPEVYITEPALFYFAQRNYEGMPLKHYKAVLKIIYDTLDNTLCTTEYKVTSEGNIQLYLYTSADAMENSRLQRDLNEKIDGYYASMQEKNSNELFIRIENINLHPAWW